LLIIFVRIKARPEKRKKLLQTLHSIVGHVRKESGCLDAGFYQHIENEEDFFVVKKWPALKDSEDHLRPDIFAIILGAASLTSRTPEIVMHTVSRSKELEA